MPYDGPQSAFVRVGVPEGYRRMRSRIAIGGRVRRRLSFPFAAALLALRPWLGSEAAASGSRELVEISDAWRFIIDVDDLGEKERSHDPGYDRSKWASVPAPKAWDLYDEALWGYEGIGWYARTLDGSCARVGRIQRLHFDRVKYHAKVWLNGKLIGENWNGYLPFSFDVTGLLEPESSNLLVLRVDNRPRLSWLPGAKEIEWIQYGGMLGSARLETLSKVFIADLAVCAAPRGEGASVRCDLQAGSCASEPRAVSVTLCVLEDPASAVSVDFEVPPGGTVNRRVFLSLKKAVPWSPDTPALYTLEAALRSGEGLDSLRTRFGVRQLSVRGREILLNGKRFRARGVNRYDEYGRYGPNPPWDLVRADLRAMKGAGVNLVRMHYPQASDLLSLYDEMGFAVIEEVPVNWWGNNFSGRGEEVLTEGILDQALPALERMIARDKNHPCVVIWSMANESRTQTEVGIAVMRRLLRRAKELDGTRLTTFVVGCEDVAPHRAFEDADVVSFNLYMGTFTGRIAHHLSEIPECMGEASRKFIARQLEAFPGKPYLVTEFGSRGVPGIRGDVVYTEDFQAAAIRAYWKAIASFDQLSGGVLWSWADYYHRRNFIQYAAFGPYGAVTVDRRPKAALDAVAEMFGG